MKYEFKLQPWPHQRQVLKESYDKEYWALLMEYGTGKTKVILDTVGINFEITKKIDALFVIAPNNVHAQWIEEQVPEHLPDRIPRIARVWTGANTKKFKKSLEDFWDKKNDNKLKIFTLNVEALQSSERARNFATLFLKSFNTLLAVDESTRIKTPGAKRSKFIVNRLSKLAVMKRTLTGNEITKSPFDIYMPYKFLQDEFWENQYNFHTFQHRYATFKKQIFHKKDVKVKDFECPQCPVLPGMVKPVIEKLNLKRMSGRVFPTCPECNGVIPPAKQPTNVKRMIRSGGNNEFNQLIGFRNLEELKRRVVKCSSLVKKEDCMDLPPKVFQPVYTQMNSEQIRVYKELKTNLYTEYKGVELEVLHKVALRTRFRQIVGGFFPTTGEMIGDNNPKIDAILYDLEDIDCDDPIIIWASFTAEIEALTKIFKKEFPNKNVVSFYGATPKDERKEIIKDFKEGNIDLFIANPSVAGTGLNLQRAYINYYFSNTDNSEDRWQSEDRTHRGGQTKTCLYKDLYIKGTIDDVIKKSNSEKKSLAEFFKSNRIEDFLELV